MYNCTFTDAHNTAWGKSKIDGIKWGKFSAPPNKGSDKTGLSTYIFIEQSKDENTFQKSTEFCIEESYMIIN